VDLGQTSGLARLCVADNGVGLPVGSPQAGGRGLALVNLLVRQIGGSFQWLDSPRGCTACVTFDLAA
jgi:two-component sensor histidine kinase